MPDEELHLDAEGERYEDWLNARVQAGRPPTDDLVASRRTSRKRVTLLESAVAACRKAINTPRTK